MTRPTLSDAQPPRDNWRVEIVEQKAESGLVLFEYAVREVNKEPFLLNNHTTQNGLNSVPPKRLQNKNLPLQKKSGKRGN